MIPLKARSTALFPQEPSKQDLNRQITSKKTSQLIQDITDQSLIHEISKFEKKYVVKITHHEMFKNMYQNQTTIKVVVTVICMVMGGMILPSLILYLILDYKVHKKNAVSRYIYERSTVKRSMEEITLNKWEQVGGDDILQFWQRKAPLPIEKLYKKDIEFHKKNPDSRRCHQHYIEITTKWESFCEKVNKSFQQSLARAMELAEKNHFLPSDLKCLIISMVKTLNISDKDQNRLIFMFKESIEKCIQDYENKYLLNESMHAIMPKIRQKLDLLNTKKHINTQVIDSVFDSIEEEIKKVTNKQVYSYLLELSTYDDESLSKLSDKEKEQIALNQLRHLIVLSIPKLFKTLSSTKLGPHIELLLKELKEHNIDLTFIDTCNHQLFSMITKTPYWEIKKQFTKVCAQRTKLQRLLQQQRQAAAKIQKCQERITTILIELGKLFPQEELVSQWDVSKLQKEINRLQKNFTFLKRRNEYSEHMQTLENRLARLTSLKKKWTQQVRTQKTAKKSMPNPELVGEERGQLQQQLKVLDMKLLELRRTPHWCTSSFPFTFHQSKMQAFNQLLEHSTTLLKSSSSILLWLNVIDHEGLRSQNHAKVYKQYIQKRNAIEKAIPQVQDFIEFPHKITMLLIAPSFSSVTPSQGEIQGLGMMLSKMPIAIRSEWANFFAKMTNHNNDDVQSWFEQVASCDKWRLDINNHLDMPCEEAPYKDLLKIEKYWLKYRNAHLQEIVTDQARYESLAQRAEPPPRVNCAP